MLARSLKLIEGILRTDETVPEDECARLMTLLKQPTEPASQSKPEPLRIMKRKEVAALFGVKERTVDLWAAQGLLHKRTMPGRSRAIGFSSLEVHELLALHPSNSKAD